MIEKFESQINQHQVKLTKIEKISSWLSWLRAILFLGLAGSVIYYFNSDQPLVIGLALVIGAGFYFAVIRHKQSETLRIFTQTIIDLNREEIKKCNLDIHDFDSGEEFIEDNHPYQIDLDIFGKHSVYQLINRCEIEDSKKKLAEWLSFSAKEETILSRQEAAKELISKSDWSQSFQALARISISQKKKQDPSLKSEDIINWANADEGTIKQNLWKGVAYLLGLATIVIGYLITMEGLSYKVLYPLVLLNGIFLLVGIKKLQNIIQGIDKAHYIIAAYAQALQHIEKEDFQSNHLKKLSETLKTGSRSATQSIEALAKLTHRIAGRANMLYAVLDALFLLDIHLLVDIIKWKKSNQNQISQWLDVVNELECLISISGFSKSNESFVFPTFEKDHFVFETKKMGHPLISNHEKVKNDYLIAGEGSLDIITGSNMSGKSTFQRTVGVNMVLAQTGCPVNAESLRMSRTQVFTSMRTKDNLEEHTSSFYAELKRIVQLLNTVDSSQSTFFILDEILKGTNSEDRHIGSIALAQKLTKKKAFGLISTHDLGLGELGEADAKIRNFSFNSTLENDKIIFDYLLTPGVCKSFNASQLMKNMGIL